MSEYRTPFTNRLARPATKAFRRCRLKLNKPVSIPCLFKFGPQFFQRYPESTKRGPVCLQVDFDEATGARDFFIQPEPSQGNDYLEAAARTRELKLFI